MSRHQGDSVSRVSVSGMGKEVSKLVSKGGEQEASDIRSSPSKAMRPNVAASPTQPDSAHGSLIDPPPSYPGTTRLKDRHILKTRNQITKSTKREPKSVVWGERRI